MSTTMGRRGVIWQTPFVTADGLKLFACGAMLIQTIGIAVIENGIINTGRYTQEELSLAMAEDSALMMWAGVGSVMQLIGGIAIPLFAFLLTEGFRHTSDVKKYLLRLLIFAVLSEIPYDLAVSGVWWDPSTQSGLVSMTVCLLMLCCLEAVRAGRGAAASAVKVLIVFGAILWVTIFRAQYGLCLVLLTAVFYLFYARNGLKTVLGIIISLVYVTGPLAFYGIWCYNEERKDRLPRYAYYLFYPLHLLAAGLIGIWMQKYS